MQLHMLKGKIHRATVTGADLDYEGSIEIDAGLMGKAGILPFEKVDIWSITTGDRFQTYALPAEKHSGIIGLNGAAARRVQPGDEIIIAAFATMDQKEAEHWKPKIVFVDKQNRYKPLAHVPTAMSSARKLLD